jgi:hypothetical protein
MKKSSGKKSADPKFPIYCDFSCSFAGFAPADSIGACRRDIAVYCKKAKKFNNKNSKCIFNK